MSRSWSRRPVRAWHVVIGLAVITALAISVAFAASMTITSQKLSGFGPLAGPPSCTPESNIVLSADKDSYVDEASAGTNFGSAATLQVRSQLTQNRRALVHFALPTIPTGCTVTSATLRLYNQAPTSGRTIQALRLDAPSWDESTVTWTNQPGTAGTAATSASPNGQQYQEWTVTTIVQTMVLLGNNGFLIRDLLENNVASPLDQVYQAREGTPNTQDPELVIGWS